MDYFYVELSKLDYRFPLTEENQNRNDTELIEFCSEQENCNYTSGSDNSLTIRNSSTNDFPAF